MRVLEIKKEDLKYNLNLIKDKLSGSNTGIIAVVKGNGMGLDLIEYSKFLIDQGINFLGVSTPEDAITLRKNDINVDILLMSETGDSEELEELIKNDIILTIGNLKEKEKIENISKELKKVVKAHVKIDTGFARFGFLYNDFEIEGCFTHFSKPIDEKWTRLQFDRFKNLIPKIKEINDNIKFHCCSSTRFLVI